MRYLLTGASGFLGSYFIKSAVSFNHDLIKLGRNSSNDVICDLSNEIPEFKNNSIHVIVHASGKAHCFDKNNNNLLDFEHVNVNGT